MRRRSCSQWREPASFPGAAAVAPSPPRGLSLSSPGAAGNVDVWPLVTKHTGLRSPGAGAAAHRGWQGSVPLHPELNAYLPLPWGFQALHVALQKTIRHALAVWDP